MSDEKVLYSLDDDILFRKCYYNKTHKETDSNGVIKQWQRRRAKPV
ncbi:MAG: hypothetical protein IIU79_01855 [Phascolarctobacterium sp.]|nr:hypothetical protein [Phascolarctobacterium sp.]